MYVCVMCVGCMYMCVGVVVCICIWGWLCVCVCDCVCWNMTRGAYCSDKGTTRFHGVQPCVTNLYAQYLCSRGYSIQRWLVWKISCSY